MSPAGAVGRERVQEDVLTPFSARAMTALLDRDPGAVSEGSPLPRGWHWLYFRTTARRSEVGPDGHEKRGAFLPAVDLPRRMWAGGRLRFPGELRVGEPVVRRSTVLSVTEKEGRSGPLVFVTVGQRVETSRGVAVEEEQDLVYRGPSEGGPPPRGPEPAEAAWSEPFTADTVTLFRFSALTYNGHRIHYDQPYATGEEGYPGVVVHGPLLALLLLDAATRRAGSGPPPDRFEYRAVSPLFAGEAFRLEGGPGNAPGAVDVWVAGPRGTAMRASAGWGGEGPP